MNDKLIGVEIGATKLQVVVGNDEAVLFDRQRLTADRQGGATSIRSQLEGALRQVLAQHRCRAIGVGFGGPVNVAAGKIALSHQVEGWADFPLRDWVADVTGLPAVVENDTNAAALAEALRGAGQDHRLIFYTNFGSGMGGGMVIDGKLYHGATPGESELGLTLIDKTGANFESRCCGWAVDRKVQKHIEQHPESPLASLAAQNDDRTLREVCDSRSTDDASPSPPPPTKRSCGPQEVCSPCTDETGSGPSARSGGGARLLLPALRQGDAAARAILEETAEDIAFAISHVTHLFHPEVVVLGGGLSLIGEPLRQAVARFVPGFVTKSFQPGPDIRLSVLREDVVCVGALLLARRPSASSPTRQQRPRNG